MSYKISRNMRLVCEAFDKEEIRYFTSPHRLFVYSACRANLKHRKLRPSLFKVTVTPQDEGILFESSLPIVLRAHDANDQRQILRLITKENYGMLRGGLVFHPETMRLSYRLFYAIGEEALEFHPEEALSCLRLSVSALSDGYETIVNTLDNDEPEDNIPEKTESLKAELESLFDQMFASQISEGASPVLPDGQTESGSSQDGPASTEDSVNSELRTLLDDLLEDDHACAD